ncbi:MAG: FAD binding domain-containing protein [Gemmataceae bacterium]|nr:FAD binding domain-containing protein [Gemmataceae bacterium]
MKNFSYYRPATVEQAVSLLENRFGNTELLGGGTDLHDLQKEYVSQPARVVSLGGIAQLQTVQVAEKSVTIGAGRTLASISEHPQLRQLFPALATAAGEIAGPQLRNMATLGGNLCQRNRCWYFRDEHSNCLLKSGSTCFALDGENKYHSVFTQGSRCVAVTPSTIGPVLIALGASVEVQNAAGKRLVEIGRFFKAPNANGEREHALASNDVVVAVQIPVQGLTNAHYEVRQKLSSDWPIVQAAVSFQGGRNGEKATDVKIVLGQVAPVPHVAQAAMRAIENQSITEQTAAAAGQAATQGAKPLSQNAYKLKLIEVAVKRALLLASGARPYWLA